MKSKGVPKKEYIEYALRILQMKPSLFSNEKSLLVKEIIDVANLFKETSAISAVVENS